MTVISGAFRYFKWPYQAMVIKTLEQRSSRTVFMRKILFFGKSEIVMEDPRMNREIHGRGARYSLAFNSFGCRLDATRAPVESRPTLRVGVLALCRCFLRRPSHALLLQRRDSPRLRLQNACAPP